MSSSFVDKFLKKIVTIEPDAPRLARSLTVGMFIAFSPYIGLQTIIGLLLAQLANANKAVVTLILYTINNPWTMVPIAALDYIVGTWITERLFNLNLMVYNPSWMNWVNSKIGFLTSYLGIEQICLWCFLIGGTVLALVIAFITYFLVRKRCEWFIKKYAD